jgi:pyruvate dehydrogenase E2 component (dihydrolipoamide acetyltransferase)
MAQQQILIPDIGDAEDVEVIEILAKVGAQIGKDDPIIVIESDKASMEVPASISGTLRKIIVALGDKVRAGQAIAVVEVEATEETKPAKEAVPPPAPAPTKSSAPRPEPTAAPVKAADSSPQPSRRFEVRIPDIGDAEEVTVVEVAVKVGQNVAVDDLLVVIESDKASMEIPSPVAGRVASVDVSEGAAVTEGSLLAVIEAALQPTDATPVAAPVEVPPTSVAAVPSNADAAAHTVEPEVTPSTPPSGTVYAGPSVRRLARELGVDLAKVQGSGPRARILKSDVDAFVKTALATPRAMAAGGIPPVPPIDFSRFGAIEAVELTRIRARGAENLHRSWLNIPHVTQHDEADVTELEAFREGLKAEAQSKGVKLTPLAFIVKAVVATLRTFPTFNASLDPAIRHLIVKRYYHMGLAVDTPEGLVVPVLRDADRKGVFELAKEIESLSQKAQQGKLAMGDLQGASFTISSLGAIGGTGFTPIINAPEVAILGVSRLTMRPHWNGTEFEPRRMLPVSLSYDHRAINGAEAGRFVTTLCRTLAEMRRILL